MSKSFQFDILSPQWLVRRSTDQRLQRLLSTAEEWKAIVFSRDFLNDRRPQRPGWKAVNGISVTYRTRGSTNACLRYHPLRYELYESSQLKPESNKMTEKKEKSDYQGQYKDSTIPNGHMKERIGGCYRWVKEISHSCHRFDVDWGMLANSILRHPLLVLEYFYFQPKESGSPSSSAITKGRFRYFEKTGLLKMSQTRLIKIDIAVTVLSCRVEGNRAWHDN